MYMYHFNLPSKTFYEDWFNCRFVEAYTIFEYVTEEEINEKPFVKKYLPSLNRIKYNQPSKCFFYVLNHIFYKMYGDNKIPNMFVKRHKGISMH